MKKVEKISFSVEIPGSVFDALLENELLQDPFYSLRENEVSWVFESDRLYEILILFKGSFALTGV